MQNNVIKYNLEKKNLKLQTFRSNLQHEIQTGAV